MDHTHRLLNEEEGRVAHAYQDHLGFWTIGVGHLIDKRRGGKLPEGIIDALLEYDTRVARLACRRLFANFDELNDVRQAVLVSMVFQMGEGAVSRFRSMRREVEAGNFHEAHLHGLDSTWAREQTPRRAQRQMKMLRFGAWVPR